MEVTYRAVNAVGRVALSALGVDVRVHHVDRLPTSGPVVLAATHTSFLDFVMLERAAVRQGRYVRFLARYDAWAGPVVSFAMDRMGHVPVDRAAPAAALLHARRLLDAGEALGVFPEAGISRSFTVRPLMPGAAALSRATGAPVLPVAMWGAQRISTAGDPTTRPDLTRGRVVDVSIGEPFTVAPGDDLTAATTRLSGELAALLDSLQRLPHHRPERHEYAVWHPAHLGGHAPTCERAAELSPVPRTAVAAARGPASAVSSAALLA